MGEMYPKVEWCSKTGGNHLRFTFGEKLTAQQAEEAVAHWQEAFAKRKDQCVSLIWDCRKMKAYESAARVIWTNALNEMKPQIGSIWLISNSTIIKMGASVMAMATSLHIKNVNSDSEVRA